MPRHSESGPPADTQAEKAVLGCILLDNESFFDDSVDLTALDFSLDSNKRIYALMNDIIFGMVEGVTQVDIVTLSNELARRKELSAVGGAAYLAGLTEGLPRNLKIDEYTAIVKEKARLRKLSGIFDVGSQRVADQSEASSAILESIQDQLIGVSAQGGNQVSALGEIDVEGDIKSKRSLSEDRTALEFTWGITEMDEFTHGAFKGEFSVVAGEESGGKSSLLLQMLIENAKEGTPCGLFSMEMSKPQVKKRCYPLVSDILTSTMIRDPRLINAHTHIPEMERVTREISKLPLYVDDTRQMRIDKLIARMRMMRKKFGCKLFGVDYVQLVKGMPGVSGLDAFQDVISKLRDFPATMEPDCHIVALSSYSNTDDGVGKSKKRTTRSLYGGSLLRYAAQNVIMLAIEDPEKKEQNDLLGVGLKFAKQRDGKRGKVECFYDREHYRFCQPQPPLR